MNDTEKLEPIRHTLAHLLAAAVLEHYPHALCTIGPAIDNGFYYDFDFSGGEMPSDADLKRLEKTMRKILLSWSAFTHKEVSADEARSFFADNPYKLELIDGIIERSEPITFYTVGAFTDLCRGGHTDRPVEDIPSDAFTLTAIAGAYWRGNEENKMLTRIYGLGFRDKDELDAYLQMQEEAKKRDHRKIGKELDLFATSELIGSGLPLFTPKGTVLREKINTFSQALRLARGYQKVWIPHITKNDLYKVSGHWDKFGHELFLVKSQETKDQFVLKPMNCPHHQQLYVSRPRSYRDLPLRYMSTTEVYRDEKTGELGGLSRVRAITQDDSHIFCTVDQIESEYQSIMEMVVEFYRVMGMELRARLSFRDPNKPEAYLGDASLWERAQTQLQDIAERSDFEYWIAPGEAAFYGPKIDFMVTDALGREYQLATAQLDFIQPSRFELTYTDSDGKDKMPIMIHLAIAGSLERFLSVYIEHTAGNFPLWVSPEQIRIISVAEAHQEYAHTVFELLKEADIRVTIDDSHESLGKKIRNAKKEKLPYFLVIGDKEIEAKTVTLEARDGVSTVLSQTDLLTRLQKEIKTKKS